MNTMPWNYWIDADNPKPLTIEAINKLEEVLARNPSHPMAIHLYIHAVESSSQPERAEAAADILLDLVPGAGHLVHMPSHIYWRVGRYADASKSNEMAAAVDEAYIAACNAQGFYPAAYYPHNIHFLWPQEVNIMWIVSCRIKALRITSSDICLINCSCHLIGF